MAARPNTLRTLTYGQRLAKQHVDRLETAIEMAEGVLADNKLLSGPEVQTYKDCIRVAKKQLTLFTKIQELDLPSGDTGTPRRKRGRPSQEELEALAEDRGEAVKAAPKKRRGRPPKAKMQEKAEEVEPAPKKRRGRPPKAKAEKAEQASEAPTKRRGRPPKAKAEATPAPKKRRGRPPKAAASSDDATQIVVAAEAPKRKRGRPKGSKNKVLNGKSTAAAAA